MTKKIRTRRTFPVTVTHVAPQVVARTPAERRAMIFCPRDEALTTSRKASFISANCQQWNINRGKPCTCGQH